MESQIVPLPHGATFIYVHKPDAPAYALKTMMRTGHIDGIDTRPGLAHFTEHMLFHGSAALKPQELSEEYPRRYFQGVNAGTNTVETTLLHSSASRESYRFPQHELLSGYLPVIKNAFSLDFAPDLIEQDRTRIVGEIQDMIEEGQRREPRVQKRQAYFAAQRPHKVYQLITQMGEPQAAQETTRDELIDFHARYYVGSRLVIVCAGPTFPQDLVTALKDYCCDIPAGSLRADIALPFHEGEGYYTPPTDTTQNKIAINIAQSDRIGENAARRPASGLAISYLQDYWRRISLDGNHGYHAALSGYRGDLFSDVEIDFNYKNIAQGLDTLRHFADYANASTQKLDEGLFNYVKARLTNAVQYAEPTAADMAGSTYAEYKETGKLWSGEDMLSNISAVQPSDVQTEIKRILCAPCGVFCHATKDAVIGLDPVKRVLESASLGKAGLGVDPADVPVRPAVQHVKAPGGFVLK